MQALVARLSAVVIECRDAREVMAQHDGPATLHYVDPPYLPQTRARGNRYDLAWRMYRHELSPEDHAELLDFLCELDGMVALSGYPDPLYDARLNGWRRIEKMTYADGARKRTEILGLNPALSGALDRRAAFRSPARLQHHPERSNAVNVIPAVKSTIGPIGRLDPSAPILIATGPVTVAIRAGTSIDGVAFSDDTPVDLPELAAGTDYVVMLDDGHPVARSWADVPPEGAVVGGFHFAPFGNAAARAGGNADPAINPYSCWDAAFRPAAADPRGMTLVIVGGALEWQDIYILGTEHHRNGTSRFGAEIADGRNLPYRMDGAGRYEALNHAAAVEIYAAHGKALIGAEGFFAGAFGVQERKSRRQEPKLTGKAAGVPYVSRRGPFDATGTMWQWCCRR